MGVASFFIRTFGCPVQCPWCDSAGTWHPKFIPKHVERLSVEQLAKEAAESGATYVVVTGGEPTIHDLRPLIAAIEGNGQQVGLETSGGFEIKGQPYWTTLSPKRWKLPLEQNVRDANEFKIIVEMPEDIEFYLGVLRERGWEEDNGNGQFVWLHPEWSQRENPAVLKAICDATKKGGGIIRAGWQLHKLYQVDKLDERAAKPAPLGGIPSKGF